MENREKIAELYKKYSLTADDVYKHKHYLIITRSGIEKIMAKEDVNISYGVIKCEPNFAVVQAVAHKIDGGNILIETFGSALKGKDFSDGNTNSWYVMEMAEKRAMSRAVLKLTGFYELGVFAQDESEEFQRHKNDV